MHAGRVLRGSDVSDGHRRMLNECRHYNNNYINRVVFFFRVKNYSFTFFPLFPRPFSPGGPGGPTGPRSPFSPRKPTGP